MATESDLRSLLRDPDPGTGGGIDVDAVLRRARRRRRPRLVAAAIGGALAASAVVAPVVALGTSSLGGVAIVADAGLESAGGADAPLGPTMQEGDRAVATLACGTAPIADGSALPGLELDVVAATLAGSGGDVTLTLVNTGDRRVAGVLTGIPAAALVRDGAVVALGGGGAEAGRPFDLDPGGELVLAVPISLESCDGKAGGAAAGAAEIVVLVEARVDGGAAPALLSSAPVVVDVR